MFDRGSVRPSQPPTPRHAEEIAGKISPRFFLRFSFAVDLYTRGEEWAKQGPYLTALRHRVAVNGVIT